MPKNVYGYQRIPVQYLKEGDTIVAVCPILDVSAYGRTLQEAERNFRDSLHAFIEETAEHDTLDQVLTESGWVEITVDNHKRWNPPEVIKSTYEEVALPA
ncbi:MAG: type II toxin-antitoxin system HicB family antitoxin [Candidatus Omnitrophica bacterium]|nr:type II toxin-antitoxin system HicB family antitoxin [Candidatus Omnitrophota bacterium]